MLSTPGAWRRNKEFLWSGYFPGSKAFYEGQAEEQKVAAEKIVLANYILQLLTIAADKKMEVTERIYV